MQVVHTKNNTFIMIITYYYHKYQVFIANETIIIYAGYARNMLIALEAYTQKL